MSGLFRGYFTYYEERHQKRVIENLRRRAKAFGFVLQKVATDAPVGADS
ncbi:hypothetical protein [Microvirga sp. Mcv34]|nr:hypothetical protein [Microvirga sp. Mcv34]